VKQLVLFHHDPGHTDVDMQRIVEQAQREFPSTILAIEGTKIAVSVIAATEPQRQNGN
jgi:hypothetical protein